MYKNEIFFLVLRVYFKVLVYKGNCKVVFSKVLILDLFALGMNVTNQYYAHCREIEAILALSTSTRLFNLELRTSN